MLSLINAKKYVLKVDNVERTSVLTEDKLFWGEETCQQPLFLR